MWLIQVGELNDKGDSVVCLLDLLQIGSKLELTGIFDDEKSFEIVVILRFSVKFVR